MSSSDHSLVKWAQKGQRCGVTLSQLTCLLELAGSESVAAISQGAISQAVNYRQKLERLEKALSIGRLTTRIGSVTQPTDLGHRVAAEVRLLLMELSRGTRASSRTVKWVFGAGETWLQTVVVPTLARWPTGPSTPLWEVTNLRTKDLCAGLREGRVHFGLLRSADLEGEEGLEEIRAYHGVGYTLLMACDEGFETLKAAVAWAVEKEYPLIQQGTSWLAIRAVLGDVVGDSLATAAQPAVYCETHPQAAASVANGRGWTIVPSIVARNHSHAGLRALPMISVRAIDEMSLVISPRVLPKLSGGLEAAEALKREIGLTIGGLKR